MPQVVPRIPGFYAQVERIPGFYMPLQAENFDYPVSMFRGRPVRDYPVSVYRRLRVLATLFPCATV